MIRIKTMIILIKTIHKLCLSYMSLDAVCNKIVPAMKYKHAVRLNIRVLIRPDILFSKGNLLISKHHLTL